MVSPFGRGFDSLQLHWTKKGRRKGDLSLFLVGLETAEATELAHVHLLNLNTGRNLEH